MLRSAPLLRRGALLIRGPRLHLHGSRLCGAPSKRRCTASGTRWTLRRVVHLQHAAADLVFLDRFEQRLEVAFAKTIVALALDELEEDRPDRVGGENLQEHLGLATVDHAFAVDQDAIALKPRDVLTMLGQARIDLLEIGVGRRRHERQAGGAQGLDSLVDVPGAAGDVLDALAAIYAEIFLDLAGI